MIYQIAADLVLLLHAAFIGFVIVGGLLALWKPWLARWHLPALAWGAATVGLGWICPLTPLENTLRQLAGQQGYAGGFIEHYFLLAIYPPGLTRSVQIALAGALIAGNLLIYIVILARRRKRQQAR